MNKYGQLAWDHWGTWRPNELLQIRDPELHFAQVGQQVAQAITSLAADLAGEDPPGETYTVKTGRLGHARFTAEETILRQLVLLPPEPGHPQAQQNSDPEDNSDQTGDSDPTGNSDPTGTGRGPWPGTGSWLPTVMTPGHPYYPDDDETS